jgi:hypothetical protein
MLKGQSLVLMAIALILILALLFLFLNVNIPLLDSNQIEKDIEVRSEIHTMGNALDAAKLYMETAVAYSTYQACYDNLKNGGWDVLSEKKVYQGYALRDSSEQHPTILEFKQSFENSIKENLGLYGESNAYTFLSDYHVNLPSYNSVNAYVDENTEKLYVTAIAESNLNIQKTQESGEQIRLEKESMIYGSYSLDCYGIYLKGTEIHNQAKAAIQKVFEDMKVPKEITASSQAELNKKLSDYNTTFVDNAKAAMYALSKTEGDYDVGVYVMSANMKWSGSVTVGTAGAKIEGPPTPEVYVRFDVTNIRDDQQFPVYDGSAVSFNYMTLTFVGKYGT